MVKAWSLLLTVQNFASYFTGRIASDERVIFFPTSAYQRNSTHWTLPIHGWVFQPKEDSMKRLTFRSLLKRVLKVPSRSSEERILDHRLKSFVVDNERWKQPKIMLEGIEYDTAPSKKNGHFQANLTLSTEAFLKHPHTKIDVRSLPKSIGYYAVSSDETKQYGGTVHLVPPEGITILSDIDDTIKITNVVNKREMLRNTFMRPFEAVPGMAQVYQKWCSLQPSLSSSSSSFSNGPHVHLHLLSASLYQLYEELETFRTQGGFPPATYTLKTVRPKKATQTLRILLENPVEFKRRALTHLFETYPHRCFVLVGDTGEKDPQVYASIAAEYPNQILGIFLRSVAKTLDDDVPARVQQVMKEYGIEKTTNWMVFEDASELLSIDLATLWNEHTTRVGHTANKY